MQSIRQPALAAASDRGSVVRVLLEAGAAVSTVDSNGRTPLHWAVEGSSGDSVRQLRAVSAAGVNLPDSTGSTALHLAAEGGDASIVQQLLEHGAAVEPVDQAGIIPLQVAIVKGNLAVVKLLLSWAPLDAAGLKAAIQTAVGEQDAVDVLVYLLQQLAAVDEGAVQEVLQDSQEFMEHSQVMLAMVKALRTATAASDAVAVAQAAEARDLAEKRRGLQHLTTGLAATHLQLRQQQKQEHGTEVAMQQQQQQQCSHEQQQDVDMQDVHKTPSVADWLQNWSEQ